MNKMWKRSLSLFLAVVMIVGMVPMNVFATELECAHENVDYIDEPATCIWEGYYAEYCNDCQQYLVEELLPAAGHEWDGDTCTVCGETQTVEEIPEQEEAELEETEEAPELEQVEAPAVFAAPAGSVTGTIWLDKNRDEDLYAKVMALELDEMVLSAVDMAGSNAKVYYNRANGSKADVSNFMDLASMYEELKDVLTGQATLHFTIGSGASAKDAYVTFRNIAHLQFEITMPEVESEGEPADLAAAVQNALDAASIVVTHGGDIIDWEALPKAQCTVTYNAPGGYTWPAPAQTAECAAGVTITICDSVDGATQAIGIANVVLVDTTPTYTVTFKSGDSVLKSYKVLKNHNLPEEALAFEPVRQYYNFLGWDAEVAATVTADVTYTAQWEVDPQFDTANNNGIADYEELFEVKYLVAEDVPEVYASKHQKYGAATFTVAVPECPYEGDWDFLGWAPAEYDEEGNLVVEADGVVAKTVTNHAVYVGQWAERTKIVVSYTKYITGGEAENFTRPVKDDGTAIEFPYTASNQIWDGWYYTDSNGETVKWDFDTVVALPEGETTLYLYGTLGFDMDGKNGADGTAEDPVVDFIFQHPVEEVNEEGKLVTNWYSYHSNITWHVNDGEDAKPDFAAITIPDTRDDDKIYTGSKLRVEDSTDVNAKKHYMEPSYVDDRNNNLKDDAEETAKITVNDTALGTIAIPNHEVVDGNFLANTNGDTDGKNGYETKIVATPAKGANSYVSKLLINGIEQDLNFEADGSAWILLHEAKLTASKARTAVAYDIQVVFATKAIEYKSNADIEASGVLVPGKTYTDADINTVYDAVVASPAREAAAVEVNYVAREKETVTVNVSALKDDIIARYGTLANTIINTVWPGDTVEVELSKMVRPISFQPEAPVLTAQQVVDSYILELQGAELNELLVAVAAMKITISAKVRERANIHPFMYTGTETVVANYKGTPKIDGQEEHKITVADNRAVPTVNVKDKDLTVTVGKYSDKTLLNNVTLSGVAGKLVNSFEDVNARTYKGVPVYFAGNETTKPAVGTFNLTINKAQAELSVKSVIVEKHEDLYDASPVVNPSDVGVVSVVAGLDLNELDLDLSKINPQVNLKNIKAKAWISLTDDLKEVMELLNVDTSSSKSKTLEEIESLLRSNKDLLKSMNLSEKAINAILKTLEKVNQYTDADLEIYFTDNVYPTNPGMYLNLAVVSDSRYDADPALGTIMIAPAVLLPDRGAQLTYEGKAEHMFAVPSKGEPIALDVTPAGAKVYYYGLNAELAVWSKTEAPSLPGIYLASTVFTDADGKLCSDAALLVIGMTDVTLDVETDFVEFDGKLHSPAVTVTDKNGNTVTDAAITMISGTAGVDNDNELGLEDLGASVNISFPDAVHTAWKAFFKTLNDQDKVKLPHINEDLSKAKINPATLVKFLKWCKTQLNAGKDKIPASLLEKLNVPQKYINKTEEYYNLTLDKMIAAAQKLENAAKKLPDGIMEITFEQNKQYKDKGVYLYFGIVTDPDYVATANAGLMVIKAPDDAMVLLDTHAPYNGNGQKPYGWDNTNRDGITLVIDREAGTVNFLMDGHLTKVIEKFNSEVYDLNGKTVAQLYAAGEGKAEELVARICTALREKGVEKIKAKLPANTAQDEIDALINAMDLRLGALRTKLESKLTELKKSGAKIVLNGELPKNVGTYEFYAYSYAIEVAKANLYIEPIYVRVAAGNAEKIYDGQKGIDDLKTEVSYYSFEGIEGGELKEVEVKPLPAGVTEQSLGLKVDIKCEGKNVGEYPIEITSATIKNTPNFSSEVDKVNGTLTIKPMALEVKIEDAEKYFGNADPEYKYEIVSGEIFNNEVEIVIDRVDGEAVGTYELTAALEPSDTNNYTVAVVGDKTPELTINKAEIKVTIDDAEKCFDAEDPDFAYTYEIVNGLETYSEAEKAAFVEALEIKIVRGEQLEGTEDGEDTIGDVFELVVDPAKTENKNVAVDVVPGKLTITLGDYVCWNVEAGKYYRDLSLALEEADVRGPFDMGVETIQMLADYAEDYFIVATDSTLDLNGFTVTSKAAAAVDGAHIVDTTQGEGKLVIGMNRLTLDEQNKMLPVHNGSEYIFVSTMFAIKQNTEYDGEGFYLNALPAPSTKVIEMFQDGVDNNNLKIKIRLTWDGKEGVNTQDFAFRDDVVQEVYNSYRGGSQINYGLMFKMIITGVDSVTNLKAQVLFESGTDAEIIGNKVLAIN